MNNDKPIHETIPTSYDISMIGISYILCFQLEYILFTKAEFILKFFKFSFQRICVGRHGSDRVPELQRLRHQRRGRLEGKDACELHPAGSARARMPARPARSGSRLKVPKDARLRTLSCLVRSLSSLSSYASLVLFITLKVNYRDDSG
jgi:hypothetical protein